MMRLFRATAVSVLLLAGCGDEAAWISAPVPVPLASHVPGEPPTVPSVGVQMNGGIATVIWHMDPFNMGEGYTVEVYAGSSCTGTNLVPGGSKVTGSAWTEAYHLYVNVGPLAGGPHCARVKSNGLFSPPVFQAFVTVLFSVGSANSPPEAGFTWAPLPVREGDAVSFSGTASDADGDALAYEWTVDGAVLSSAPSFVHVFADDGLHEVSFTVSDGKGGVSTSTLAVAVENVAPMLLVPAAAATGSTTLAVPAGGSLQLTGAFSDPGMLDTHVLELDCNYGGAPLAGSSATAVNPEYSGTCNWAVGGVYQVLITIRDDDGGSGTRVAGPVVVYEARAGDDVTGGGWIHSPPGACQLSPECADASGKATFGFVSGYVKASALPTGSAVFQFHAGPLTFKSGPQLWLVVAGSVARFTGSGTVNGSAGFDYLVTAVDGGGAGGTDRFRIRIWNRISGDVVYDNQSGADPWGDEAAEVSGGSIVIHARG